MNIQEIEIEKLIPYHNNPRKDQAVDKVASSINEYGFQQPIVVDKNMVLIVGHTRLMGAKKLGLKKVPVTIANLSESKAKAYRIADNRLNEDSAWDFDLLDIEIKNLLDDDYNIDLLGFDSSELDKFLKNDEEYLTDEDEVPEPPREPISKLGDIYKLGEHRLMCGDSTILENINKLMDNQKADVVFTDPPYGMKLNADWSSAKIKLDFAKEKGILGGKKHNNVIGDHDDFTKDLINTVFNNFIYCKEIFLWGADYYAELLRNKNDGSWVVWDKRLEDSTDKMYGSTFELCWSKFKHKRKIARVKWAGIFGTEQEFDKKRHHPTQKPIKLVEWFINEMGLKDKKLFVDLYGGSGSTILACEKTKRKCYMMELDPIYVDVIIQRWENFTGKKSKKIN